MRSENVCTNELDKYELPGRHIVKHGKVCGQVSSLGITRVSSTYIAITRNKKTFNFESWYESVGLGMGFSLF